MSVVSGKPLQKQLAYYLYSIRNALTTGLRDYKSAGHFRADLGINEPYSHAKSGSVVTCRQLVIDYSVTCCPLVNLVFEEKRITTPYETVTYNQLAGLKIHVSPVQLRPCPLNSRYCVLPWQLPSSPFGTLIEQGNGTARYYTRAQTTAITNNTPTTSHSHQLGLDVSLTAFIILPPGHFDEIRKVPFSCLFVRFHYIGYRLSSYSIRKRIVR